MLHAVSQNLWLKARHSSENVLHKYVGVEIIYPNAANKKETAKVVDYGREHGCSITRNCRIKLHMKTRKYSWQTRTCEVSTDSIRLSSGNDSLEQKQRYFFWGIRSHF
jgi:hypothetical protein